MEMSSEACLLYMQEAGSCIDFIATPASHLLLTGGLAGKKPLPALVLTPCAT
jgi:hypothetical protein